MIRPTQVYNCHNIDSLQFSKQFQHQQPMEAVQPQPQSQPQLEISALKLYVFGSCESDQYYHPKQDNQSKRPICLTDLERFTILEEDQEGEEKETIFNNPLFGVKINKITCGALHTVIASVEGKVYTFGCNDEGALGRDGVQKIPIEVKLDHVVDLISAGDNHSVFASSGAGVVYFTGNYKYLRGEKMVDPIKTPIQFDINQINNRQNPESKLTKVVSGSNHSAILIGGKIFIRGEPEAHTVGRRINQRHKLKSSLTFEGVGLNNVEDLWCGGYHTVAKVKKGESWTYFGWGLNKHGQLGVNNYEESPYPIEIKKLRKKNIIEAAAGTNFTVFLADSGELFGCGQNDDGQLGLGKDYQFVDSEEEEERKLEAEIKEKMSLNDHQNEVNPQKIEAEVNGDKPEANGEDEPKNEEKPAEKVEEKIEQKPAESHGLKEHNIYIKSIKPIPIDSKLNHIIAGSEFVYGWNQSNLYSWGFGMNFVLLNGNQEDEYEPFKVKSTIINNHKIHQLSAGAQHVAYLSYPKEAKLAKIELSEVARKIALDSRKKLSRRKRSPAQK